MTTWIGLFILFGVLVAIGIWVRLLPPSEATTVIRTYRGELTVTRGHLQPLAKEQIVDLLHDAHASGGFIAVVPKGRVVFSRRIPKNIRQQLRNILLSQNM